MYRINMADMVFEVLCSVLAVAAYLGAFDDDSDPEKGPRRASRILAISFLIDIALQVYALVRQFGCSSIVNMIFQADCLNYGRGISGTEGRDTLIRLRGDLKNVMLIGFFEFIVAVAGGAADVFVLFKTDTSGRPSPHVEHLRVQALALALLDAVLSALDFFFATRPSQLEAEKLLAHVGDQNWWCTTGVV